MSNKEYQESYKKCGKGQPKPAPMRRIPWIPMNANNSSGDDDGTVQQMQLHKKNEQREVPDTSTIESYIQHQQDELERP